MARSLYRFYLYAMFVVLVTFAVSATSQLLTTLFTFTPLRGEYASAPAQTDLVRSLVFALVSWLTSGTLGGLHYWLIRRDLRSEPAAGTSAIRAFFLNATEAAGTLLVVPLVGFALIENWAFNASGNVAYAAGIALPTLTMIGLFEWERRRARVQRGAALIFQRLHFFGVQLILLFFLASAFSVAIRPLINGVFFGGHIGCNLNSECSSYNLTGLVVTLLWFTCGWLIYGFLTSQDSSRLVRMIMHGISLAFGIGFALVGVFLGLELAVSPLFHLPISAGDILGSGASHDFVSPLLSGLLIIAISHWLLRDLSHRHLVDLRIRRLSEQTIAAVLLAGTFWWGCAYLLYNLLQAVAPAPTGPDGNSWVLTIALILSGLSYIPLDLSIQRRFTLDPTATIGPRRGLVLALLGASILAVAIGGATALYTWLTAVLGSPLTNWPQVAHAGLAAATVGVIVASIYLWTIRAEHLFTRHSTPVQPPAPPSSDTQEERIGRILDELLAGQISREEAATRLHALIATPAGTPA